MREIGNRERITIQIQGKAWEGKVGALRQQIPNEKGEVCCEAEFAVGFFDLTKRKLIPTTPGWFYAIGAEDEVK